MEIFDLHFLRPWAWLTLPLLLIVGWWFWRNKSQSVNWKNYIDPHLANWLIDSARQQQKNVLAWPIIFIIASILVSFSAAGPAWIKQPVAVSSSAAKAVIVLDLSPSMVVEDISPSRIARARFKILEILKNWKEGYIALVAYADDGYVISPLTDDAETIANMVKILSPTIMPAQGSAVDLGLEKALKLLKSEENPATEGDILLITDGIVENRARIISTLMADSNVRISILSIGTTQGAPIPEQQGAGFITDNSGAIVIAKLNNKPLQKISAENHGLMLESRANNEDIISWLELIDSKHKDSFNQVTDKNIERWIDAGPFFLLPILVLMIVIFRKGFLFSFFLIAVTIPNENTLAADNTPETKTESKSNLTSTTNSLWNSLWYNNGQLGDKNMAADEPELALEHYQKPEKIAEALYRSGLYQQAAEEYSKVEGAEARHNEANSLAQTKKFKKAIEKYQEALQLNPSLDVSRKNLEMVEKLLKESENGDQKTQKNSEDKDKSKQDKNENTDENPDKSDAEKQQQNKDSSDSDSKSDDMKNREEEKPPQDNQSEANEQDSEEEKQQQANQQKEKSEQGEPQQLSPEEKEAEKQQQQMIEQWLRQIVDDPSRLLRNKLILEQRKRQRLGKQSDKEPQEW